MQRAHVILSEIFITLCLRNVHLKKRTHTAFFSPPLLTFHRLELVYNCIPITAAFPMESVLVRTAFVPIQKPHTRIKRKIPRKPKISRILCLLYSGFFLDFELPRLLRSLRRHLFGIRLLRSSSRRWCSSVYGFDTLFQCHRYYVDFLFKPILRIGCCRRENAFGRNIVLCASCCAIHGVR